jgi:hypothetical protein
MDVLFFETEEADAVMLAYGGDRGRVDHRSSGPGSSGKDALKVPAQFGSKKDIHIPSISVVREVKQESKTVSPISRQISLTEGERCD